MFGRTRSPQIPGGIVGPGELIRHTIEYLGVHKAVDHHVGERLAAEKLVAFLGGESFEASRIKVKAWDHLHGIFPGLAIRNARYPTSGASFPQYVFAGKLFVGKNTKNLRPWVNFCLL